MVTQKASPLTLHLPPPPSHSPLPRPPTPRRRQRRRQHRRRRWAHGAEWVVVTCVVRTHSHAMATMAPFTAVAHGRRTPRARGTRATYITTRVGSARCMLSCGPAPPPPALAAHRPPPPTTAISPRRRSVPPSTLRHHRRIHHAGRTCHRRGCRRVGTAFSKIFRYRRTGSTGSTAPTAATVVITNAIITANAANTTPNANTNTTPTPTPTPPPFRHRHGHHHRQRQPRTMTVPPQYYMYTHGDNKATISHARTG